MLGIKKCINCCILIHLFSITSALKTSAYRHNDLLPAEYTLNNKIMGLCIRLSQDIIDWNNYFLNASKDEQMLQTKLLCSELLAGRLLNIQHELAILMNDRHNLDANYLIDLICVINQMAEQTTKLTNELEISWQHQIQNLITSIKNTINQASQII